MGEYAEYGFDQQGWYGMFVACGIWCLADVSSVSPSSVYSTYCDNQFPTMPNLKKFIKDLRQDFVSYLQRFS